MATEEFEVFLQGGSPWGFRLQGGREFRLPIKIAKVELGGKAAIAGIQIGDLVTEINEVNTSNMYHTEALTAVKQARSTLSLVLKRAEDTQLIVTHPPKEIVTKLPMQASQQSTNSNNHVLGGQSYMKKIFGSIDDLLTGFDDDLPPVDRTRSKTLPKKLPPRDTRLSSSESSEANSLSRTSSVGGSTKTPNWYKQMYKEMHESMEKESHLSKLLTTDAQKGAFRKYDGVSTVSTAVPTTSRTTDHVPRRLHGGGRAAAVNPNRKSLPNIHASNFNFMSTAEGSKPSVQESKVSVQEERKERRKSINSEWYKQLQKGGEIPEAGLAVIKTEDQSYTSPVAATHTVQHTIVTAPVIKPLPSTTTNHYSARAPPASVDYHQPPDFFELRKSELKNLEVERERETIRQKRERERIEEEERLRQQKELDRLRIAEEEEERLRNNIRQSKVEEMVSKEIQENQARYHSEQKYKATPTLDEVINSIETSVEQEEPEPPEEITHEKIVKKVVFARAKYSFHPQGAGELEFKKGQILRLLQQIDENWYEGEINNEIGIFPVSYVQLVEEENVASVVCQEEEIAKNVVMEPAQSTNTSALPETAINLVKDTSHHNGHAMQLTEVSHTANGVASLKPAPLKLQSIRGSAKARYTFKAANENELSFKKGEIVSLVRQIDDNWFEGETNDGHIGICPVNYVEVLTPPSVEEIEVVSYDSHAVESSVEEVHLQEQHNSNLDVDFEEIFADLMHPSKSLLIEDSYEKRDNEKKRQPSYNNEDSYEKKRIPSYEEYEGKVSSRNERKTSDIDDLLGMGETFRAVYSYNATNEDEVDLQVGDIVHVLEQCDDGWFVGTSQRTGAFGTFPGNYVVTA